MNQKNTETEIKEVDPNANKKPKRGGIDFLKVMLTQVKPELDKLENLGDEAISKDDSAKVVSYISTIAQIKMQAVVSASQAEAQAMTALRRMIVEGQIDTNRKATSFEKPNASEDDATKINDKLKDLADKSKAPQ
jgi:hypothetical protein